MMASTLTRSLEAVASDALYGAASIDELQTAWDTHCAEFADESQERERLLKLYNDRCAALQSAELMVKRLGAG